MQREAAPVGTTSNAVEAGVSRQRLYEHHADLVGEFKTTTGRTTVPPNVQALQQQLADSRERVHQLEGHVTMLQNLQGYQVFANQGTLVPLTAITKITNLTTGEVVFQQAYGSRKLAGEPGLDGSPAPAEPMTEDTIFDMASLTKSLATATAVMPAIRLC